MGLHKILRDGGGVMTHMRGFQRSFLAERRSESVFKISCGRIQKNIPVVSKSLTHPSSTHSYISVSLSLSLSCMAAPYNLQVLKVLWFTDQSNSMEACLLYTGYLMSIKKYVSVACKFPIKELTLFVMVSVEFVTIVGNVTCSFICHKSHLKCL